MPHKSFSSLAEKGEDHKGHNMSASKSERLPTSVLPLQISDYHSTIYQHYRDIAVFTPLPMGEGQGGGAACRGRLPFLIQLLQLLSNLVIDTLSEGFHCHSSLLATALLTH